MPLRKVVQAMVAMQYDGGNAQEILDHVTPQIDWQGWTTQLVSEADGQAVLALNDGMSTRTSTVSAGDWVIVEPFQGLYPIGNGADTGRWVILPDETQEG